MHGFPGGLPPGGFPPGPPGGFGGPPGMPPGGYGGPPIFAMPAEWLALLLGKLGDLSHDRIAKCVGEGSLLDHSDNQIGNGQALARGDSQKHTLFQVGGASQNTRVVTICCQASYNLSDIPEEPEIADVFGMVRGTLRWGTGSARFSADFDFQQGVQLSVPAAFAAVDVQLVDPNDVNIIAPIMCFAGMAWETRAARSEPEFTYPRFTIGTGEGLDTSNVLQIPAFARSVFVFASEATAAFQLEIIGGRGATSRVFLDTNSASPLMETHLATEGIRIPGGAQFVRLTTDNPTVDLTVKFGLNL